MSAPEVAPVWPVDESEGVSLGSRGPANGRMARPPTTVPVNEEAEDMAVVEGPSRGRRAAQAGEEALMGAAATDGIAGFEVTDESGELVKQRFLDFLGTYSEEVHVMQDAHNESETRVIYPYAEQATQMARRQLSRRSIRPEDDDENRTIQGSKFSNTLFLDFTHVLQQDMELAEALQSEYVRFEPFLRKAVLSFILDLHPELHDISASTPYTHTYFIAVHNLPALVSLRSLRTDQIGRLAAVSGTVTRTSEVRPELLVGGFRCNKCGLLAEGIQQQFHFTRPNVCRNPRCKAATPSQFVLESNASEFCDWQKLRVQENSDEIPPGSMPRSIDVIVRNEMVEKAKAGDKCVFSGTMVVIPDGSALARAGETPRASFGAVGPADAAAGGVRGLKALGVRELTYRTCFVANCVLPSDAVARCSGTDSRALASLLFGSQSLENREPSVEELVMELNREQRAKIRSMKDNASLYEDFVKSIAPSTFGHREVKKGILLMLLGGVHKTTADGIKLRGDVNVCIVGDPSTAKSQFLKYVHSFLPARSVYASGKASSAAGLTAAVQRDQDTGEYCIEAGALMLADNGICCIDEFDKMDPNDQVAIHEAMEQQTISITKAGIQATLNARASILAAANPIYGRYDRTKTLKANVALSAPILSRFDLFFVVLDECNPDSDKQVAQHILKVHRCEEQEAINVPYSKEDMQVYIRFARTINPKITETSQRVLVDCYRKLRQGDTFGLSRSAYRITVRQLESMIRLSEALARLHCDKEVRPAYVREAFRLLKTSIIQVETGDVEIEHADGDNGRVAGQTDDDDQSENHQQGEYSAKVAQTAYQVPTADQPSEDPSPDELQGKKKKKKVKISYEEYEGMVNGIAAHLRSLESGGDDEEKQYMKWGEVVEWYLEQVEHELDSEDKLEEARTKVNLVIRRLVDDDRILIAIDSDPSCNQQDILLAVHPNYPVT